MRYIECSDIEKDLEERYKYYRQESEIPVGDMIAIDDELQTAAIIAKYALDQIKKAPTADVVEVKHGEWDIKAESYRMIDDDFDEQLF